MSRLSCIEASLFVPSVVISREESDGGGIFSKGTVQRVKPYRSRNAIRVACDDGGYDMFSLKNYHVQLCPVDELCDDWCEFALIAKQYVFWLRNETLLLKNERAVNLHQSIAEKYMRNADKLKQNFPTQLRILELCCGSKFFANYLRAKFPCAIIVTLDIVDSAHPTHVADVAKWNYNDYYPIGWFTIVWASPPCTEYSPAKTIGIRNLPSADKIVRSCLEIIVLALGEEKWHFGWCVLLREPIHDAAEEKVHAVPQGQHARVLLLQVRYQVQ